MEFLIANQEEIDCGVVWANSGDCSVSCWVYIPSAVDATGRVFGCTKNNIPKGGFVLTAIWVPTETITFEMQAQQGGVFAISHTIATGQAEGAWHHVYWAVDGTNRRMGVNGTYNADTPPGKIANDVLASSNTFLIGDDPSPEFGSIWMTGYVAEIAIWQDYLSASEVQQLYAGGCMTNRVPLSIKPSTLVGYWPLDDFADGASVTGANSVRDWSGNGWHGTPANTPLGKSAPVAVLGGMPLTNTGNLAMSIPQYYRRRRIA
jgi:hypothetical protein